MLGRMRLDGTETYDENGKGTTTGYRLDTFVTATGTTWRIITI